jgi:hypothetical protein
MVHVISMFIKFLIEFKKGIQFILELLYIYIRVS